MQLTLTQMFNLFKQNKVDEIKESIKNGFDINQTLNKSRTFLFYAVRYNNIELIDLCLKNGANINHQDVYGKSIIHFFYRYNNKILEYLCNNNLNINMQNNIGDTPLHIMCKHNVIDSVDYLIDRKINLETKNNNGDTVFHIAVLKKCQLFIQKLIKNNANIESEDNHGNTPLNIAVMNQNTNNVYYLISKNANIYHLNKNNESVLFLACSLSNFEVAKCIFDLYTDDKLHILSNKNNDALMKSIKRAKYEIVDYILNRMLKTADNNDVYQNNIKSLIKKHLSKPEIVYHNINNFMSKDIIKTNNNKNIFNILTVLKSNIKTYDVNFYCDKITKLNLNKTIINFKDKKMFDLNKYLNNKKKYYIDTLNELLFCIDILKKEKIISVDTEFDRIKDTTDFLLCLMQISTCNEDFIIDTIKISKSDMDNLHVIFDNDEIIKVFHSEHNDISVIKNNYNWTINNTIDTQRLHFIKYKEYSVSLKNLVKKYFNYDIDKTCQKSDWSIRPLSNEMINYAYIDSSILLPLIFMIVY